MDVSCKILSVEWTRKLNSFERRRFIFFFLSCLLIDRQFFWNPDPKVYEIYILYFRQNLKVFSVLEEFSPLLHRGPFVVDFT